MCVCGLTIIDSDNGLSPRWRQAIIRTNAGILLIRPLGTNFIDILIENLLFSFKKMRLMVSSAKRRPFCVGLNVLNEKALSCKTNTEQTNDSDPIFSQQGGLYSLVIILIAYAYVCHAILITKYVFFQTIKNSAIMIVLRLSVAPMKSFWWRLPSMDGWLWDAVSKKITVISGVELMSSISPMRTVQGDGRVRSQFRMPS